MIDASAADVAGAIAALRFGTTRRDSFRGFLGFARPIAVRVHPAARVPRFVAGAIAAVRFATGGDGFRGFGFDRFCGRRRGSRRFTRARPRAAADAP